MNNGDVITVRDVGDSNSKVEIYGRVKVPGEYSSLNMSLRDILDIAGGFALDTVLVSELSKVYGLNLKGESARKIVKKISLNNIFLGATQVGINSSFNLLRKVFLATAPFTQGLSLLPYGPIAIMQAAISVRSTRIIGQLAAKEIFWKSKGCLLDPSHIIKKIIMKESEIFNHANIYLYNKNLENNFTIFLP